MTQVDKDLTSALLEALEPAVGSLKSADLVMVLQAIGTLQWRPGRGLLAKLKAAGDAQLPSLNGHGVCVTLWAFAHLTLRPRTKLIKCALRTLESAETVLSGSDALRLRQAVAAFELPVSDALRESVERLCRKQEKRNAREAYNAAKASAQACNAT